MLLGVERLLSSERDALLIASKKVVLPALSSPTMRTENWAVARQLSASSDMEKRDERGTHLLLGGEVLHEAGQEAIHPACGRPPR